MGAIRRQREEVLETGEPEIREEARENHLVWASLWMTGIPLLFFFLPVVNGLAGGIVGGFRAGSTKSAFLASILPAMAVAFLLWMLLTLVPLTIMGRVSDVSLALLVALSVAAVVIGAGIGGTIAQNRIDRLNRA